MFHLPATSARFTAPDVEVVVLAVEDAIAEEVSTAAFSFLAQAARTAAQQQSAMPVVRLTVSMEPPLSLRMALPGVLSSQPNVPPSGPGGKSVRHKKNSDLWGPLFRSGLQAFYLFLTSRKAARSSSVMRFEE